MRTAEELRKLMIGQQPEEAIRIMYETGLLHKMLNLPEHFEPLEMDQRNKHHELTFIQHTLEVLKNVNRLSQEKLGLEAGKPEDDKIRMYMNLSALFHDVGKLDPRSHKNKPDGTRGYSGPEDGSGVPHELASSDVWKGFAEALQFSNEETETINTLVSGHMRPHAHVHDDVNVSDKSLRRFMRTNPMWTFQYIHAMADAMSKSTIPDPDEIAKYEANMARMQQPDFFGDQSSAPAQDLLNGHDIYDIVGLPAAPPAGLTGYIEVVKERIREHQDSNPNLTKEEAISIVQVMARPGEPGNPGELDAYRV